VARQPEERVSALQHRFETVLCVVGLVAATVIGISFMARLADARPALSHHQRVAQELRRLQGVAGSLRVANRRLRHAVVERPSVQEALTLASVAYGVPRWQLASVAQCESGLRPGATNHTGSGASGLLQFMPGTFRATPFGAAGLSIFSPYANALAGAWLVRQRGWTPWSCRP
jgi:soluble lytic murein transglycosylase-like protein